MVAHQHRTAYSHAEYLRLERDSNVRHEYFDGQIFAMAGGTPLHAALVASISGLIVRQLAGGRCRAFSPDLRVRIKASGLSTYPDLAVVCGPWEHDSEDVDAIANPTVIVEVLSPSTESYDRGDKFDHYKRLSSLAQYVLVSQSSRSVEVFTRGDGDAWTRGAFVDGDVADLHAIDVKISVSELYDAASEPTT